ncbi:hypothetical protein [Methanofollis aquaemaris]|nr:hypothetical protein [Methanofollis aquaemaris]
MVSERTAYMMLFILGLCLLAGPGAARNISAGDTFFAYEDSKNLDFSALNETVFAETGEDLEYLTRYTNDNPNYDIENQFTFQKDGTAYRIQEDLASYAYRDEDFGTYFAHFKNGSVSDVEVYLCKPKLTLDIVLADSHTVSVADQTVAPSTRIAFKINSGKVGLSYRDGDAYAQAKIELRIPNGTVVSGIGDVDLKKLNLTAQTVYAGNDASLKDLEPGPYSVQAVWDSPESFDDYATGSNKICFTISETGLSIKTDRESINRNYDFPVTICGDAKKAYYLYITDAGIPANRYPQLKHGQPGVTPMDGALFSGASDTGADTLANDERAKDADGATVNRTAAIVTTTTSGTRTLGFYTSTATAAQAYTIKVVDPDDVSEHAEVTVRIEEGELTIAADGPGPYFFGDEIRLSGTSTDSNDVYLFMTGPGLHADGVSLVTPAKPTSDGAFVRRSVECDDTWEYCWDTSVLADTGELGTYTVYAASADTNENGYVGAKNLEGVNYQSISLEFPRPSVSASMSRTIIRQGDSLRIDVRPTGNPPGIRIWIFGENGPVMETITEQYYNRWQYSLSPEETVNLSGDYYVIVQHPMEDEVFDVRPLHPENASDLRIIDTHGTVTDLGTLSPQDAAQTVADTVSSCDDTAVQLSFEVEECRYLFFDVSFYSNEGRIADGKIRLDGWSNFPAGTLLDWTLTPYNETTVLASGETEVRSISSDAWDVEVDLSALDGGNYTVTVSGPDGTVKDSLNFTLYGGSEMMYPESGDYGIKYAFVHPSLAEPFGGRYYEEEFNTLITLIPKNSEGSPFPSDNDLKIESRRDGWSAIRYIIEVDGNKITSGNEYGVTTIKGWSLAYPAERDVQVHLRAVCEVWDPDYFSWYSGEERGKDFNLLTIVQTGPDGTAVPGSAFMINKSVRPGPSQAQNVTALSPGWNFVSVPKALAAGNNTAAIFAAVDTAGHSIFGYDTAGRQWVALKAADEIAPLEGFWIYANGSTTVPLTFSTVLPSQPAERNLSTGWNAVGVAGAVAGRGGGGRLSPDLGWATSARDALFSVNGKWTTLIGFDPERQAFETAIVSGGSDVHADSRQVYPNQGYWLYMTEPGTLSGLAG